MKKIFTIIFVFLMLIVKENYAAKLETEIKCFKLTEYDDNNNVVLEDKKELGNLISKIFISGNLTEKNEVNEFVEYNVDNVDNGDVRIALHINKEKNLDLWEIDPDKETQVEIFCSKNIDDDTFVLESYAGGLFDGTYSKSKVIYEVKEVQIYTGCYYKILVNYFLRKNVGENKLGPIKIPKYETKHVIEEYKIYLANDALKEEYEKKLTRTPKMNLGNKIKVDGKNYTEEKAIKGDDPHFGWDIGQFYINGYTSKVEDVKEKDKYVFLKNVGDKISLWFELTQDIRNLNNKNMEICDEDASDIEFEEKINGYGTLIIKVYDHEHNRQPNIVYNNFLHAETLTGANTEVEIFEEGDYEVALDYEIQNKDKLINNKTNYKIRFNFKIRNGNCMIFPFDEVTGDELQDGAITKNGFYLDFAESRFLKIYVEKMELIQREDSFKLDSRGSKPAKDGDKYTDEGIYVFKVKNEYTKEQIIKTIYVGENEIYKALSESGYTIDEINKKVNEGYIVKNGKLVQREEE